MQLGLDENTGHFWLKVTTEVQVCQHCAKRRGPHSGAIFDLCKDAPPLQNSIDPRILEAFRVLAEWAGPNLTSRLEQVLK